MKKAIVVTVAALALAALVALGGCASGTASSTASSAASSTTSAAASNTSSAASASASAASSASATTTASSAASSATAASSTAGAAQKPANGEYSATFTTDSSMFHVNDAYDGKGTLTVTDGGMTIHVSLVSKKIVKLYVGTAAEAQADAAGAIEPTIDKVTLNDGTVEEVYGFDIPVPVIGAEFDVAILGEKGAWYDHKVSVSNPVAR